MQIRFIINSETPAKKNSKRVFRKGNRTIVIPSERFEQWHLMSSLELQNQLRFINDFQTIDFPCEITMNFFHSDKRKRDSDNGVSSILDLLKDNGILKDDNWQIVRKLIVTNAEEKKSFCIITIDNIK